MRTANELLEEFVAAGGRVAWRDGKPSIAGAIADSLILEIREQREAFLNAWDERAAATGASRGWGTAPSPVDVVEFRRTPPRWPSKDYRKLDAWVRRQPARVVQWVIERGSSYGVERPEWSGADRMQCAMADLWDWQRCGTGTGDLSPAEVIQGCEEVFQKSQ